MDELVDFVLDEVAMDGPQGSSISSVVSLIRSGLGLSTPEWSIESLILNLLINHSKTFIGQFNHQTNKLEPNYSFTIDQLNPDLVDDWFIWVADSISWEAITGSHQTPSSITPAVYAVLCAVSRARASGKSVAALGKQLGIDQRSMYHYVKAATNIGAVKKFRTTDQGSWTNLVVHVRYLNQSKHWQAHIAADNNNNNNHNDDDDPDRNGDGQDNDNADHESGGFTILLNPTHLHSNPSLIRRRILSALSQADQQTIAHSQIANKVGLLYFVTKDQRKFNSILREMIDQGLIERVIIQGVHPGTRSTGLRLSHDTTRSLAEIDAQDETQIETSHPQLMIPIERQIVDLLAGADEEGLISRQIGHALGEYGPRAVDQTLVRLSRDCSPVGLSDLSVCSMTETIGREKRTRWFTRIGYLRRCARDGLNLDQTLPPLVGEWSEPLLGIRQYDSVDQLDSIIDKFNVRSQLPSASAWKSNKAPSATRGRKPGAVSTSPSQSSTTKPIGRPRKHPLAPGQLTYYERRKRQLAEQAQANSTSPAPSPNPSIHPPPVPLAKPTKPKRSRKANPPPSSPAREPNPAAPRAPSVEADISSLLSPEPLGPTASTATETEVAIEQELREDAVATPVTVPASVEAESKMTLTLLTRQRDLLRFIESQGGIIEHAYRLNESLRSFLITAHPTDKVYLMDRQVLNQVVRSLVKSEQCRLTVVATEDLARVEVISLPSIDPAGPVMSAWLSTLQARPRQLKGYHRAPLDRAPVVAPSVPTRHTTVPTAQDSLDVVSDFFRQADKVLGYWRGALPGRFARARVLHRHLVRLAQASEKDQDSIAHVDVIQKMALDEWLRVILVSDDDHALDEYLEDPVRRQLPLERIPTPIAQLVRNRRHRQALVHLLDCLVQLGLISPGSDQSKMAQNSTWKISKLGPIYSFNQPAHNLVNVVPVQTDDEVDAYWDQLQANCMPGPLVGDEAPTSTFPAQFSGKLSLVSALTTKLKWQVEHGLTSDQRKYLSRLAKDQLSGVLEPSFIVKLEQAILARASEIQAYLSRQLDPPTTTKPPTRQARATTHKRSRKSAARSAIEHLAPSEGGHLEGAASLRRKAQDAAAQRQRDFNSILERFKLDHAQPVLNEQAVDYLAHLFTGIGRVKRGQTLDATDLERELAMLLPNSIRSESIIPKSIVTQSSSSYALPRLLTLPPRPARKDKGIRRPPKPTISSGTQLDFISATPRTLPPQTAGTRIRLSRHYFSEEQEELVLDAGAVIKARAKLNHQRLQFSALESLFPGMGTTKLRQILIRLIAKPEHELYHSRLVQAWTRACQTDQVVNQVGSSVGASLTQFDLAAHVRALRAAVNKHALRLAGAPLEARPDTVKLAYSTKQIVANYTIESVTGDKNGFEDYWRPSPSNATREHDVANLAFSLARFSLDSTDQGITLEQLKAWRARGALKLILVTPESAYNEATAHSLLRPFVDQLESIVRELLNANLMAKVIADPTRRMPGRNFILTNKFVASLNHHLTTTKLELPAEAAEWAIASEPGAAVKLVDLISSVKVLVEVLPELSTQARDREDYQTRKADDEVIESVVRFQQITSCEVDQVQAIPSPPPWPGIVPTDHPAQTRLRVHLSSHPAGLLSALDESGPAGLSLSRVHQLATPGQVQAVTADSVAFWAGINQARLIGYQYIESWTVEVSVTAAGKQLVLPTVWIGHDGAVVDWIWQKAVGLVVATLSSWPGADWDEVGMRASGMASERVLSLTEVIVVLETLERCGRVRHASSTDSLAQAGWYLTPDWSL